MAITEQAPGLASHNRHPATEADKQWAGWLVTEGLIEFEESSYTAIIDPASPIPEETGRQIHAFVFRSSKSDRTSRLLDL